MPRRNRPNGPAAKRAAVEPRPLSGGLGDVRSESAADGEWLVRQVPGSRSAKTYRCPGCDQEIRPGTAHLVAWPAAEFGSAEQRRHWHLACWSNRQHRRPTSRRW